MKQFKKYAAVLFLVVATALSSCSNNNESFTSKPIEVKVKIIKPVETPFQYEYTGNVIGTKQARLATKLMGEVIYFPFEAGAYVKENQLIAKIKSADIEAKKQQIKSAIAEAEAAFNNTQINFNRIKSLYDKGSSTKKELEDITLAYEMAKQRLNSAKEMEKEINDVISYSEIRAPFNGFITNKFYQVGDLASPGQPLLILEDISEFKVVAEVPSEEINFFKKNAELTVFIDAVSSKNFSGIVTEVNPGGNPYSKQFEVQILLRKQNPDYNKIKSGMFAKVVLENKSFPIITIDENLLIERGQLTGVYTVSKNNEALLRWIRLGKKINNKFEVLSGLSENDEVIINKSDVKEGLKVEVKK